jgi:cardiolipin synthase
MTGPRLSGSHDEKWPKATGGAGVHGDLTLANAFTAARFVLVPFFAVAWYGGHGQRALWLFVAAVATDLVDGLVARVMNQPSRLGALLDPIADKLLILTAVVIGVLIHLVPFWLLAVILARDALLAVGVLIFAVRWRDRHGPEAWRPTRIGKYAMVLQSASIALVLLASALDIGALRPYTQVAMIMTAVLTITAGAQYTIRAARAVQEKR